MESDEHCRDTDLNEIRIARSLIRGSDDQASTALTLFMLSVQELCRLEGSHNTETLLRMRADKLSTLRGKPKPPGLFVVK